MKVPDDDRGHVAGNSEAAAVRRGYAAKASSPEFRGGRGACRPGSANADTARVQPWPRFRAFFEASAVRPGEKPGRPADGFAAPGHRRPPGRGNVPPTTSMSAIGCRRPDLRRPQRRACPATDHPHSPQPRAQQDHRSRRGPRRPERPRRQGPGRFDLESPGRAASFEQQSRRALGIPGTGRPAACSTSKRSPRRRLSITVRRRHGAPSGSGMIASWLLERLATSRSRRYRSREVRIGAVVSTGRRGPWRPRPDFDPNNASRATNRVIRAFEWARRRWPDPRCELRSTFDARLRLAPSSATSPRASRAFRKSSFVDHRRRSASSVTAISTPAEGQHRA